MKNTKPTSEARSQGLRFAVLLLVILTALFWKSFLPGYIHFSNDGPLGQQMSAFARLPGGFAGAWNDQNDIGFNGGVYQPSVDALLRW